MFKIKRKVKKQKFEVEIKQINEEINRSKRYDYNFGVLAVNVSHSVPRGLSKIIPGKVISFHLLSKYIRNYDKMTDPYLRRYYIILSQTDRDGVNAVKQRIYKLAKEHNWGGVSVGTAVYSEDGKSAVALLEKAISETS